MITVHRGFDNHGVQLVQAGTTKILKGALASLLVAGSVIGGSALATPVFYYGQDAYPGSSTANSDAAHTNFMAALTTNVGTENFGGFAANTSAPIVLSFPGSGTTPLTASLQGNGSVKSGNNSGSHSHSGSKYYLAITGNSGSEFNIDFSTSPIAAFGFYGSDISDSGSLFYVQLTASDGTQQTYQVTNSSNLRSGNQMFWGFSDPTVTYTKLSFLSTSAGDYFGFDDMTIGDTRQVRASVPEPGELGMLGLGLGLLSLLMVYRRRQEQKS